MIWKVIYLSVFLAGLALAVHSMLHGAEQWRRRRSAKPSAAFNPPTVAAIAIGFGACGYPLTTRTTLGVWAVLVIAILAALASYGAMTLLMAKWALRASGGQGHDADEINGQVAIVSRTIAPDDPGEITYFAWDQQHVLPAQSVDGTLIPEGTEVVIELIDDGVARVELWSVVEQRL
jgi:hypothetical protein